MIGIGEYCYDELMLGGMDRIGSRLFFSVSGNPENEKAALELIRYSVDYYLGWTPKEASRRFSEETLRKLGIYEEVKGRIICPPETKDTPEAERQFLLSKLYPKQCTYDPGPFVEAFYERALLIGRLPEGFFGDGEAGRTRAGICLLLALRNDGFSSEEQMYRLMGSRSAARWLQEKKLKKYCDTHFSTPADLLKSVLPASEDSKRFYLAAKERIRTRREGALRRYGTLGFSEEKERRVYGLSEGEEG